METIEKMAQEVFGMLKGYIGQVVGPLLVRLTALEARQPEKGERGEDGKSVDPAELIAAAAKAVEAIPKPKDGIDGVNGKDYDPAALEAAVKRHVDALPKPADGKDADATAIAAEVLGKVKKFLDEIPAPKDGTDGIDGKQGAAGRDFDPELLTAEVQRAFDAWPKPKNGENGKDGTNGQSIKGDKGEDGKDADPEVIKQMAEQMASAMFEKAWTAFQVKDAEREVTRQREIAEMVTAQVKAIPPAAAGKDADPEVMIRMVKDAFALIPVPKDGTNGRDAPSLDEIVPAVVKLIPVPKDGAKGEDGRSAPTIEDIREVIKGEVAIAAKDIPPGRDGRDAEGKPGRDGVDGTAIDDFDLSIKGEGTLVVSIRRSDGQTVTKEIELDGWPAYRDTYEPGSTYSRNQSMTYGGSVWVAKQETNLPPPGNGWRMAVKGTR